MARVHSGDPSLYGAIAEQMRRLDALGIPYEVVPGVSSFQAAAAALKIELTPAGKNQTVILTRAAGRTRRAPQRGPRRPGPAPDRDGPVPLGRADARGRRRAAAPLRPRRPRRRRLPRRAGPTSRSSAAPSPTSPTRMADAGITRTALILVGPMLDDAPAAESHLYDRSYSHLFRKARDPIMDDMIAISKSVNRVNHSHAHPRIDHRRHAFRLGQDDGRRWRSWRRWCVGGCGCKGSRSVPTSSTQAISRGSPGGRAGTSTPGCSTRRALAETYRRGDGRGRPRGDRRGDGPVRRPGALDESGSTADLARRWGVPVVLVVDARGVARSVAALVLGFSTFDPTVRVAGVIANKVGGRRHYADYLAPEPAGLGPRRRAPGLSGARRARWRSRRATSASGRPTNSGPGAGSRTRWPTPPSPRSTSTGLLAPGPAAGPAADPARTRAATPGPSDVRVALARDPAFCFYYEDNLDHLRAAGAEIVPFSPLDDPGLPEGTELVYLGGRLSRGLRRPARGERPDARRRSGSSTRRGARSWPSAAA